MEGRSNPYRKVKKTKSSQYITDINSQIREQQYIVAHHKITSRPDYGLQ